MSALPHDQHRTPRDLLRELVVDRYEHAEELRRDDLIEEATKAYGSDADFLREAAASFIAIVIPEVLSEVVATNKGRVVRTRSGIVSRRKIELTARERLSKVFEGQGDGYRSILAMRKSHLLALNVRDQKHVDSMTSWIAFRRELADRMTDTQKVGDLSSRVLDSAWKKHLSDVEGEVASERQA